MKIAVIGGGNGGYAAAADLSEQGHAVSLWRRDPARAAATPNPLFLRDHKGERPTPITEITADLAKALEGAALIVCPTPATSHDSVAAAIALHLVSGQVVFLPPGTFGSFIFAKALRAAGSDADVAFAEAGTLPYLARKRGPAEIAITT
ncbi:MAG: NAD(P)-binding domain-containing protein, partial [Pseudomonadota bacterium]